MGADLSRLAGDAAAAAAGGKGRHDKPKTILCPPLFERDLKARSRWAKSSYDFNFSKPALRWLLGDFFDGGLNAVLFFAPPIDERISVKAKLGNSAAVIFGGSGSGGAGGGGGNSSSSSSSIAAAKTDVGGRPGGYGNVTVRYQPLGPHVPSTFFDVKANPRVAGDVAVRACFFSPESGLGVFASAPLSQGGGATGRQPEVGVRYSSPDFAAGSVVRPGTGEVSGMWMAGRLGDVTAGWQLRPCRGPSAAFSRAPLDFGGGGGGAGGSAASALPALSSPSAGPDLLRWLRDRSSVALAYSPRAAGADGRPSPEAHTRAGQPAFCAAVELVEGRAFCLSFFQHVAAVRRVFNPFEGSGVVGIANSIDVGLRLAMPLSAESGSGGGGGGASSSSSPPAAAAGLELGAAWQPNKNTYAKVKIDSGAVSVMAALKSWYQPSAAVAATAEWRFGGGVRFGVFGQVENFGALRYERPRDAAAAAHGATLTQRHEATPAELALAAREKPLVPGDEAFGARNVEPATQLYM
jgi:hypothetical protein